MRQDLGTLLRHKHARTSPAWCQPPLTLTSMPFLGLKMAGTRKPAPRCMPARWARSPHTSRALWASRSTTPFGRGYLDDEITTLFLVTGGRARRDITPKAGVYRIHTPHVPDSAELPLVPISLAPSYPVVLGPTKALFRWLLRVNRGLLAKASFGGILGCARSCPRHALRLRQHSFAAWDRVTHSRYARQSLRRVADGKIIGARRMSVGTKSHAAFPASNIVGAASLNNLGS